jgi:hypothetical protein
MGLDAVELITEIEDSFDVPIPEKVSLTLRTPGDVFDYLLEAGLKAMPRGPCLSHALFNRVRRAVVDEFQVQRGAVKPKAEITKLIPQFRIRERRTRLFKRLALRKPPPIIADRTWIRRDFGTFGQLAKEILARNYALLAEEAGAWNPHEAWNCLRLLIAFQVGLKIEDVTRNAEFVNDLGFE